MKTLTLILGLMGLLVATSVTEAQSEGFGFGGRRRGGNDWDVPKIKQPIQSQPIASPKVAQPKAEAKPKGIASKPPEVDVDEVRRRGNLEEWIDNGESRFSTEDGDHIAQIAALPPNDDSKWSIVVISKKQCPACDALHKAWYSTEGDDDLRCWAKPELHPRDSWAHFTWYDYDDPHQSWRWKKTAQNPNPIEITGFPTVILQPPRDNSYGNPKTVVLKYIWSGDSRKMAEAIHAEMRRYVDTLHKRNEIQGKGVESRVAGGGFQSMEEDTQFCQLDPRDLVASEDPPAVKGFGQQQIPPLNTPFDPRVTPPDRDEAPRGPRQERLMAAKRAIYVVTDTSLISSPEQDQVLNETVQAMQQSPPLNVHKYPIGDLSKNLREQIKANDVPVVLLVEGGDVIEKRQVPRVNASSSSVNGPGNLWGILGPVWNIWTGLGTLISWACAGLGLLIFVGFAGLSLKLAQLAGLVRNPLWQPVVVASMPQPAPAPAPAIPTPQPAPAAPAAV